MSLTKVDSIGDYDFYLRPAAGDANALYNIVPKGSPAPNGGYRNMQYIEKIKGVKFPDRYQPTKHGMSNLYKESQNLVESANRYLIEDEVIKEVSEGGVNLFVDHLAKEVSEDNYEEGEIGDRQLIMDEKIGKKFDSFDAFKKYCSDTWGLEDNQGWSVVDNRLTYQRLENDQGIEASPLEQGLWKKGKRKLWSADYDFVVELILPSKTDEDSIRQFTGLTEL